MQGESESPISSDVSGKIYQVAPNTFNIETIAFDFASSGCTVKIKTVSAEHIIPCGYENWERGQTSLFIDETNIFSTLVASSGAWTADNTFTMVVRLYETPFFHTLVYRFTESDLMIETRVNVSFMPVKTLTLTAYRAIIKRIGSG